MRGKVKLTVLIAGLLLATVGPRTVLAGPKEEARKHFNRAVELVDDGQLEEALIEFQRSHDLTQHFAVLYNIGQVLVSLAKPVEAVDAYERYLAQGGKKIPANRRTEVEQEIVRQKSRIATLEIRGFPAGAVVKIDGKEVGKTPIAAPVRVGVGKHTVAASAEGYEPAEVTVAVAGEDLKVLELTLVKRVVEVVPSAAPIGKPAVPAVVPLMISPPAAPTREVAVSASFEPAEKPRPFGNLRIAGIATAAVGALGLATGIICWSTANSRHDQAVADWYRNSRDEASRLQGEAQDYIKAANISYVAGGVLMAAGLVLYIVGSSTTQTGRADMHVRLYPAAGPRFAGVTAGGTW